MKRFRYAQLWLLALMLLTLLPATTTRSAPTQPTTISSWGMNAYITKRERIGRDSLQNIADLAQSANITWTREELPWALIEQQPGQFGTIYDGSLKYTADRGFGIIGMLLTTPAWARDRSCANYASNYWCPPGNVNDYARFAKWMVERYDGDGVSDAPGSPRIAAWEIWNEPNDQALWPLLGNSEAARRQRYGEMLVAAYAAIKEADPTALVMIGGIYVFDGKDCYVGIPCDGLRFLGTLDGVFKLVPAAKQAFDVLAIHPFIPTAKPDQAGLWPIVTVEGRVKNSRSFLNSTAVGRSDAKLWVTEMGWCTKTASNVRCPGDVDPNYVPTTEDQQANYLIRSMVVSHQSGASHVNWFQLEDAFNDPGREWSHAAITRDYNASSGSYPLKPAFYAFRTLVSVVGEGTPLGPGSQHTHVYNSANPYGNTDNGTYHYRYQKDSQFIEVLWVPEGSRTVHIPIANGGKATLIDRLGNSTAINEADGTFTTTLTEAPIFIVQTAQPQLVTSPTSKLVITAQHGTTSATGTLAITNGGGGTLTWSATDGATWLTLAPASGTGNANIIATAALNGRAIGTYATTITITSSGGNIIVPVELRIVSQLNRNYTPLIR